MYVYACTYKHPDGRLSYYVGKYERSYEKSKWYLGSGKFCKNFKKKYGAEYTEKNVTKKILIHSLPDRKTLCSYEKIFIASYRQIYGSLCKNQANGGEGGYTGLHTEESKRKIGKALKGRIMSEEHRRKISESHKGRIMSEETKRKISESHKGKKHPMYNINSVIQVYSRAYEAGDIKRTYNTFKNVLKNPNHKRHDEYTKLYNKHLIKEGQ